MAKAPLILAIWTVIFAMLFATGIALRTDWVVSGSLAFFLIGDIIISYYAITEKRE